MERTDQEDTSEDHIAASRLYRLLLPVRIRQSYFLKFVFALVLVIIFIGVVGFVVQSEAAATLETDVEQQLTQEADAEADQIREWIDGNERTLLGLSDHPHLANDSLYQPYVEQALATQFSKGEAVDIHLASGVSDGTVETGEIIASTDRDRVGTVSNDPWIDQTGGADITQASTTDPYINPDGKVVVSSLSVVSQDQQLLVVVEFDTAEITDIFSSGIDETFTEVVRPGAGQTEVMFSNAPADDRNFHPYIPETPMQDVPEVLEADSTGQFTENPTKQSELDEDHIAAYTAVEGTNWVVIKHAPATNAYQLRADIQWGILFFLGVALVGVVIVGGTLGRNTATAIRTLSQKAKEIEQGNYETALTTSREDEIGDLTHSINRMRSSIREHIQEAEQSRRVARRNNEQLQVLGRLLRHNMKNDMNVVKLYAEMTKEKTNGETATYSEEIEKRCDKLIQQADKQRIITRILSRDVSRKQVDLVLSFEKHMDSIREEYPDATITAQLPETAPVIVSPFVDQALEELLENALAHADGSPEVHVVLTREETTVTVRIDDTGPTISTNDQNVLLGRQDIGQLTHGSGVGLWLVRLVVDRSGASLTYEENEPRGNRITIEFDAVSTKYDDETVVPGVPYNDSDSSPQ